MSFLEQRSSGQFHLAFRFGGQRFKKALKTTQEDVADAARVRLDENLRLVAAGRLVIPEGADIPTFLLPDASPRFGDERFVLYQAISAPKLPDGENRFPVRGLSRKLTAQYATIRR